MNSFSLVIGFGDKLVEIELGPAIRTVDDTVTIRAGSPKINQLSAEGEDIR
jgi:hypothetical protein